MNSPFLKERKQVHEQVVRQVAEAVAAVFSFLVIFSVLLTLMNWQAYSRVIQDMIDPEAMASVIQPDDGQHVEGLIRERLGKELGKVQAQAAAITVGKGELFELAELGDLYPDEMRLEVAKLFEGTVPVKEVDVESFSFKDLYASENVIQEALRAGVVHYPYTATPDEMGNVFITGHSSYYPWDKGRYKDIFALLNKLESGDEYSIYYHGKKYDYRVTEVFEVQPDDVSVLEQPVDRRISTLMTCTPLGTTLRRLIVRAELTEESRE